MPISKSLGKIEKKKASNKLNPRSRKFKQLSRAQLRDNKLSAQKSNRVEAQGLRNLRLTFQQEFIKQLDKATYTLDDLHAMINAYINRDIDELEKLREDRRPGRPRTSKHDALENQLEADQLEYRDGFRIADLRDKDTVIALQVWDGTQSSTASMKHIFLYKDGHVREQ